MNDDDDFSLLDDPAVIAERARVRELLGPGPPEQAEPGAAACSATAAQGCAGPGGSVGAVK